MRNHTCFHFGHVTYQTFWWGRLVEKEKSITSCIIICQISTSAVADIQFIGWTGLSNSCVSIPIIWLFSLLSLSRVQGHDSITIFHYQFCHPFSFSKGVYIPLYHMFFYVIAITLLNCACQFQILSK